MFNLLLHDAGVPPEDTRLLRHQTTLPDGRTQLDLWRADRASFEEYQAFQPIAQRAWLKAKWWACFAGTNDGRTLFVGLYELGDPAPVTRTYQQATGVRVDAGLDEHYPIQASALLSQYAGRLYIEWGGAPRASARGSSAPTSKTSS